MKCHVILEIKADGRVVSVTELGHFNSDECANEFALFVSNGLRDSECCDPYAKLKAAIEWALMSQLLEFKILIKVTGGTQLQNTVREFKP